MYFSFYFLFVYLLLLLGFMFSYFFCSFLFDVYLFNLAGYDFSLGFVFDCVSLGFFCCVSFISGLVFSYAIFYMEGTVDMRRFLWLVYGFVLSMGLLVFSGNFFVTMVGWDGLGLVSFCLVVFYSNHGSLESGLVTVFSNRVGDVFFLLSFFFFFVSGGFGYGSGLTFFSGLFFSFLFLGAITKSAQVPFSAWLPAAMAAPTPVSSLVHSSTLVTAGVYVLIRFFYFFSFLNYLWLKLFFLFTMVLAGACANLEKDFKKVVAMSTLSQLGLMLFVLSVGVWVLSFLHLIIHAFFKSMLFLSTGSLMSHLGGNQDSRFYGGSGLSYCSFLFFMVSGVCLMGFPFYIGFYSKDLIILTSSLGLGIFFYLIFLVGCLLTVLYSFRLLGKGFSGVSKGYVFSSIRESGLFVFPVFFLFFKGWLLGGIFYWFFLFDSLVFFSGFDVLVGLALVASGLVVRGFFLSFYKGEIFLYLIGFLRWFSSGGSSFLFSKLGFHRWDFSWLEGFGGQGVYSMLGGTSISFDLFLKIGLGFLLFFLFLFVCLNI